MSRRQTELHASPLALSTLFRRRACVNYNCTPYQDTLYCTVTVHTVNTIWNTSERMLIEIDFNVGCEQSCVVKRGLSHSVYRGRHFSPYLPAQRVGERLVSETQLRV